MTKYLDNKRVKRVRRKLKKIRTNKFRLSVYRSSRNISAQIIDDKNNRTLASASSFKEKPSGKYKKSDISIYIAELLSKRAKEKKITNVYFDRGKYKYHGRVKIFAEVLRKNGLVF